AQEEGVLGSPEPAWAVGIGISLIVRSFRSPSGDQDNTPVPGRERRGWLRGGASPSQILSCEQAATPASLGRRRHVFKRTNIDVGANGSMLPALVRGDCESDVQSVVAVVDGQATGFQGVGVGRAAVVRQRPDPGIDRAAGGADEVAVPIRQARGEARRGTVV